MTKRSASSVKCSNLDEIFIWKKKILKGVGVPVLVSKKKQRERLEEIEKLKKRREQRAIEKARHEEERDRERARAEFRDDDYWERKEQDFLLNQSKLRSEILCLRQQGQGRSSSLSGCAAFGDEVELLNSHSNQSCPRKKPKYLNHFHTGYEWNKYNQTHYDHDNPPPKMVQGYKFNIFYPDLVDNTKPPTYTIEHDGRSSETCIIRFHSGPPYEDLAFRIVNQEWEISCKKGFKCLFEQGILRLYFNFKRFRYRR